MVCGLFNRRLTSFTPIFRLYKTSDLREIPIHSDGFEVSVEILIRLIRAGKNIVEVPVPLTLRQEGFSKLKRLRELRRHLSLIGRLLLY